MVALDNAGTGASNVAMAGIGPILTCESVQSNRDLYRAGTNPERDLLSPATVADPTGFTLLLFLDVRPEPSRGACYSVDRHCVSSSFTGADVAMAPVDAGPGRIAIRSPGGSGSRKTHPEAEPTSTRTMPSTGSRRRASRTIRLILAHRDRPAVLAKGSPPSCHRIDACAAMVGVVFSRWECRDRLVRARSGAVPAR